MTKCWNRVQEVLSILYIELLYKKDKTSWTYSIPECCTEEDGQNDKPPVPVMRVVNGGHPQEHEYDGFRAAWQHFHCILYRGLGLAGHVPLHVVLDIVFTFINGIRNNIKTNKYGDLDTKHLGSVYNVYEPK